MGTIAKERELPARMHGDNPEKVFKEIRELATWVIETHLKDGKPLPAPSKDLQLV